MRDFFASLRHLLAYVDLERMRLGTMAHQFIKDEVIPRLQKKLETVTTDSERDRLTSLIAEYEKYSNPATSQSRIYDKTAANIVRQLASRSRVDEAMMEDLMQTIAVDFFQPRRAGGDDLRDTLMKFIPNLEQGPLFLNKFWMHIVDLRTRYIIRDTQRHYRERTTDPQENDEGEERDSMSQVEAPSMVDEGYVRQVIKDLISFMHQTLKRQEMRDMFDRWMEVAQEKGASRVDLKHDVYAHLRDQGYQMADPTWSTMWLEVKRQIVNFFEKELEGSVSTQIRKMLRISAAEVLAYEQFRKRLAAWMLGGILRGTLAAGDK